VERRISQVWGRRKKESKNEMGKEFTKRRKKRRRK
jgi:hypothetical protein